MKFHYKQLLLLIFSMAFTGSLVFTLEAANPTAVVLLYFRGTGIANGVFLEWETATEFGTAGFMLERADSANGPFTPLLEIGLIPGEGDGITGAKYEATDNTAVNGQTYWYVLVEYETTGSLHRSDTIEVRAGVMPASTPTPTATLQAVASPQPTSTPAQAPAQTATATATQVTAVTATFTPAATAASFTSPPATATALPPATRVQTTPAPQITPPGGSNNPPQPSATPTPTSTPATSEAAGDPEPTVATVLAGDVAATRASGPPAPVVGGDTPSQAVAGLATPTRAVSSGDLIVIGRDDQPLAPTSDQEDPSPATIGQGFDGRSYLRLAFGAAVLILITGMLGVGLLYHRRRQRGSHKW